LIELAAKDEDDSEDERDSGVDVEEDNTEEGESSCGEGGGEELLGDEEVSI